MAKSAKKVSMFRPHERAKLMTVGPSLTRQEFKDECDINTIMRRYEKSGVVSHVRKSEPQYGDFVGIPDFQQSLNMLNAATESFMQLPARVRREFDNDPRQFVQFVEDPANLEKVREYGLANVPEPEAKPQRVEVVNQPIEKKEEAAKVVA